MENEEKKEVTVGGIFHIIRKRIWLVLGATILITVAAVLLIEFIINPMSTTYSMDFRYVFPLQESKSYPDGTPFFYQEIVTPAALKDAAATKDEFAGIDIDGMSRRGGIEVEAETITVQETEVYTGRYTLKVDASYFENKEQAEGFLRAVAEGPVREMQRMADGMSYTTVESTFQNAPFEDRLLLLSELKERLLGKYDEWISCYSENYNVKTAGEDGAEIVRPLKDYRDDVVVLYGESVQRELRNELESGGYYFGDLEAYKAQLKKEYERNETEKTAIGNPLNGRWTELNTRNLQIDEWINASETPGREPTLTEASVAAYADRLSAEFEKLQEQAEVLADVTAAIYQNGAFARFYTEDAVSGGGIGLAMGGVCSLVIAFLAACCIAYALEMRAKKNAPQEETASGGGDPSDGLEDSSEESPENFEESENVSDIENPEDGNEEE